MSQAANTFLLNKYGSSARSKGLAQRKARFQRIVDGIIVAVILAATGLCVSVYLRTRGEVDAATKKHEAANEKVDALATQVEKLEREVKQLKTDPGVESFARRRFGFVRSSDVIIKVPEAESGATLSKTSQVANLTPASTGGYTEASN